MGGESTLGEQTRLHKDLDVFMLLEDVARTRELLEGEGFRLKEIWSENSWAVDIQGNKTATAFVLADIKEREFDVHVMYLDDQNKGVPLWATAEGFIQKQDLAGKGLVAGVAVQCTTAERQMFSHTGYELPEKQRRDLELLQGKFGFQPHMEMPIIM